MPQLIPDHAEPENVKPIESPGQGPMHYFIERAAMRQCGFPILLQTGHKCDEA